MKNVFFQFTPGQVVFILACLVAAGFVDFYLGARFGPHIFWGISVDRLRQEPLLPNESDEAELEALLKSASDTPMTFYKELEKKGDKPVQVATPPVVISKGYVKEETEERTSDRAGFELSSNAVYTLQVGSYASEKEAKRLAQKFEKGGYTVSLKSEKIPGKGMWHRVYVGRYTNLPGAEQGRDLIKKNYRLTPVIVKK